MRSGKMNKFSLFSLLLVKIFLLGFTNGDSPPGPVYINPDLTYEKPEPIASKVVSPDSQITQTVYGFLDFTTTIGNTVMVFMPQSASISPGITVEEPTTTEGAATSIEEKPVTREQLETEIFGISPSKPEKQPSNLQNEELVVTSNEAETTTKEMTTAEPTTTTTKEAPTTKNNSVKKTEQEKKSTSSPMTTKKTTVKTTTPTPTKPKLAEDENKESVISSKVIVLAGSKVVENIVTKVEVIEGSPEPSKVAETPAIYSKVEVISGEPVEEVAINHLQPTPEYDYLSRQPSEVVDETFKVIDLKPSVSRHLNNGQKSRGPDGKLRAFNSVANFHMEEEPTTNKSLKKIAVKVSPSSAGVRILKTAAPKPTTRSPNVEPTPVNPGLEDESLESLVGSQPGTVLVRQSRRPAIGGGSNFGKNKYTPTPKSKSKETDDYLTTDEEQYDFTSAQSEPTTPSYRKGSKFSSKGSTTTQRVPSFKQNRFNRPTTSEPEFETEPTQRRFQPSSKRYDNNNGNNYNSNAAVVTPANRRIFKKHFQQQEQSPQPSH